MTSTRQQFGVRAQLDNFTAVQHHDAMRMADGGEAMRDDQRGATGGKAHERFLHEPFGFRIERGRGFVEG